MKQLQVTTMTAAELAAFLEVQKAGYIQQRVDFGGEDVADATRTAEEQFVEYFPDGSPAPSHHLFVGRDDTGSRVGMLWLHERISNAASTVFIYDIEVDEAARGHGWGRELMRYAETWARRRGAARIELNVFGGNAIARHLYSSLGYAESSVHMTKRLADD